MPEGLDYQKYGAKKHTTLPATKRKQVKAKKAGEKGTKAKRGDKPKQQETRVSSKARATRGRKGDSQSRYSDALEQQGLDLFISPEQEAKAGEDRTARDAKRGSKLYSGQEDKLPSTVTAEDGSLDRLKAAEDYSLDTIAEDAPAPDAPAPGDSQVLTDPNDGRYEYELMPDGSIKIISAPEDTDFQGMILDDPTSKAHSAIMEVFKSGGEPSAGLDAATSGAAPPAAPGETGMESPGGGLPAVVPPEPMSTASAQGTSIPETPHLGQDPVLPEFAATEPLGAPSGDLSFSSRAVADRTWDQYYGAPLETTPPDGPYQDWSHLDPKGQVEMEPLTTTSDPTVIEPREPDQVPPRERQASPRANRMSGTMARANQYRGGDSRERMKAAGASLQEAIASLTDWWNAEPEPDKNYAPGSGGYRAQTYPKQ